MPVVILKALECAATEDWTKSDSCRLEVRVDGGSATRMNKELNTGERWVLERSFVFANHVSVKLWDEDWLDSDDFLGEVVIGTVTQHRATGEFTLDGAHYILWYEVIPSNTNAVAYHRPETISVRQMLGRMGRGVLSETQHRAIVGDSLIYRCHETISVRDVMAFHRGQDHGKGSTTSLKEWIYRHCNSWGQESVLPINSIPRAFRWHEIGRGKPNWVHVRDERSYAIAGYQHYSRRTDTDNPFSHETMDWNWDIFLDPQYHYLLNYTAKRKRLPGNVDYPYMHSEWETGSLPIQWRPFWGEYVTCWGRHIHDVGHLPVTSEIHPAHTMVREHTTAAPLGDGGAMVPANRAIVGMGFSGGFPGNVGSRWQDETGANPPAGIWGDTTDCWATNLKRHPLRFKFFPPTPKPSPTAQLRARIVMAEYIQVSSWGRVDSFLERCQADDPAEGGGDLAFRVWRRSAGRPAGFTPAIAPPNLQPQLINRGDYYDVRVNLNPADQIPVGYYAIVECGWSEPGAHTLREFEITFETVKAVETQEWWDDWHMYYGVNGQWAAWWTDDFIREGNTYTKNQRFRVWTVDDLPILIRDTGIEWDGTDAWNEKLDRVEITAPGPNYFDAILARPGVEQISRSGSTLRIRARGWQMVPGDTRHEWTIRIVRRQ